MNNPYVLILATAALISCTTESEQSLVTGATSEEVATVTPAYDQFSLGGISEKANKNVKVGIFISYDEETPDEFSPFDQEPPMPMAPTGFYGLTQTAEGRFQSDYGTQAFNALGNWLANTANPDASFLKEVQVIEESATKRVWNGKGPALARSGPQMDWEITLRVGKAEELATAVGISMAKNHITLLNGHFYSFDAALQQAQAQPAGGPRPMMPPSISKNIYGPALDTYVANADTSIKRRIVIFNGCGSEEIEKLVLARTQGNAALRALDIVGMRGRSSYKHFAPQIARVFSALVNGGSWGSILEAMKFSDLAGSAGINDTDFGKIVPVLCQADGVCPERPALESFVDQI